MKQQFREVNLSDKRIEYLGTITGVIEHYQRLGYRLTLRQLYYQLVSAELIRNVKTEYDKLGDLVSEARMAGLIDWDAIEDRVRVPKKHSEWDNVSDIIDSVERSFRLPRWKNQKYWVELWTEKDALASVIQPITEEFHINLIVNRGYSSTSALYQTARRLGSQIDNGKIVRILYLGDHDASGLDMDRDIRERLAEFGIDTEDDDVCRVKRIGLKQDQIRQFNLPPNPAKITDPRAREYIRRHGNISWEVDAIPPEHLARIVREAIEPYVNMTYYREVIAQEERLKQWLLNSIEEATEYEEEVIDNEHEDEDPEVEEDEDE